MSKKSLQLDKQNSRFFLQTLVSVSVRGAGALSGYAVTIFITNKLGLSDSGVYFIAFGLITILSSLGRLGLDNTVLRYTSIFNHEDKFASIKNLMVKACFLAFLFSSVIAVFIYLNSDFIAQHVFSSPELGPTLKNFSPSIIFLSLITLIAMSLQGLQKTIISVFVTNISVNIMLILTAIVTVKLYSSSLFAGIYSIACFVTFIFVASFLTQIIFRQNNLGNQISWKSLFTSCLPLLIIVFMNNLTQWGGQIISGIYVSADQVSILGAAQRTAMLTGIVLLAVNMVVAPKYAALYKQGNIKEINKLSITSIRIMLILVAPILMLLLMFSTSIMQIFGPGFGDGNNLLRILALGQFINVITGSVGYLLSMSGHEKDLRNIVVFSGLISIVVNLILIPILGIMGSAIATTIAISLQNLLSAYLVKKRLGINIFKLC